MTLAHSNVNNYFFLECTKTKLIMFVFVCLGMLLEVNKVDPFCGCLFICLHVFLSKLPNQTKMLKDLK